MFSISSYKPPGPVAAAFIRGEPPKKGIPACPWIMGPVGSGKTNAVIFKLLRATALMPACKDGVVRAKWAVVRTDYRTLYKTTLPSWWRWFPRDYPGGDFIGGADRPASHALKFVTPRGRKIDLLMEFSALGDKRIEDILRGWEGTGGWLNEADLLDPDALQFFITRGVRYPPASDLEHGAFLPTTVVGDLNPPGDPDHWIVRDFIDNPKPGFRLYQQPSGLSPNAENLQNLPEGYYETMVAVNEPHFVQRFVHGKIGYDRSGMPVYPEFDGTQNLSPSIKPLANQPIVIGLDGALHPAGVIVQRAPSLQKRVLEELYFGRMGPTRFAEMLNAALNDRYPNNPILCAFYDPSADYGADKEGGEQSWIDIVRFSLNRARPDGQKIPFMPAPSNEPTLRIEAVRNGLVFPIDANNRGLIVSADRCPMIVKGFFSHYRFKLNPDGSMQNKADPRPEKNEYANPHDALQYACLGMDGRAGTVARAAQGSQPRQLGGGSSSGNFIAKSDFAL